MPGGVSSNFLNSLDVKLDCKSVMEAGSMLGSGAVIVLNKDSSIVNVCKNIVEFFASESCGQCAPCREGTRRAKEILTRFVQGKGKKKDIELLLELGEVMFDTSRCGLGQAAMNAVTSGIRLFRDEFEKCIQ